MPDSVLNATVIHRTDIDAERAIVRIQPDSGVIPAFTAGQFIMLGLPRPAAGPRGETALLEAEESALDSPPAPEFPARRARPDRIRMIKRAYSIASPPGESRFLEFFVVLVGEGRLTPLLWPLREGDRLWLDSICKGEFTLGGVPPGRDLVMVSTGTGLAPFRSLLLAHLENPPWRRAVLINGVRYASELGYREEMQQLAREHPWFTYLPLLSRDPAALEKGCHPGRVQSALEPAVYERLIGARLDPAICHVFLCGNPEMITATQALLEPRGFRLHSHRSPGNLHFERYW